MKQKIALIIGALVSLGSFYLVFQKVNFSELGKALTSFNIIWLVPALVIYVVSLYVRALRWALFFRPRFRLSGHKFFRPTMIGFAFNQILPSGRVGEFVRAFYVAKKEKTGLPTALATIVTERIFDGLTLLGLLALSFALMPPIDPDVRSEFWGFTLTGARLQPLIREIEIGCAVLAGGVLLFLIPAVPRFFIGLVEGFPGLPAGFKKSLAGFIQGVAHGFESVREPKVLAAIVAYSLLLWGLIAMTSYVLARGFADIPMSFIQSLAVMALVAVFIIIPAAPGYWGLFEAGILFSLKVLNIQQDSSISAAYAIVLHLLQFLPVVAIGLTFAAQDQVRVSNMKKEEEAATAESPAATD